jgi:3'(2'), 5'-bisphosphate nucleotidase
MTPDQDIDFLLDTAALACREILEVYNSGAFDIRNKEDTSPYTAADLRSNAVICQRLRTEYPEIPIISEETASIPYEERKTWHRLFLVDPLDGTKEFLKRNGEFTVNIALVEEGFPVAGVVARPTTAEAYVAAGGKAFYVDPTGVRSQLCKGPHYSKLKKVRVVASRSHPTPEVEKFVDELRSAGKNIEFVSLGSSLKICMIAANLADVYPRLGPTMEWDTAAAHAVAVAAGCSVTRFPHGGPLVYNKENLLNPWFLVA